jgi:hypothetical protein
MNSDENKLSENSSDNADWPKVKELSLHLKSQIIYTKNSTGKRKVVTQKTGQKRVLKAEDGRADLQWTKKQLPTTTPHTADSPQKLE